MASRNTRNENKFSPWPGYGRQAPASPAGQLDSSSSDIARHFCSPAISRRLYLLQLFGGTLLGLANVGCGRLKTHSPQGAVPWELKTPQMSPDAVVLEVAILQLPSTASSKSNENTSAEAVSDSGSPAPAPVADVRWADVWQDVDEQFLSIPLRRRLAENGFRCGMIDGRPSPSLQTALDEHAQRHADSQSEDGSTGAPTGIQRLQNRAGRRGKILTSETRESLSVLLPENGRIRGKTYPNAQCLFSVRSFPQGDGSSELELTPELEYGSARPRWLGESAEGSFRVDTSREHLDFESLRIQCRLTPGQMLVLGPLPQLKGLGRQFFAETAQGSEQPRVLIIRLAQTQLDDLFAPELDRKPFVSVPD